MGPLVSWSVTHCHRHTGVSGMRCIRRRHHTCTSTRACPCPRNSTGHEILGMEEIHKVRSSAQRMMPSEWNERAFDCVEWQQKAGWALVKHTARTFLSTDSYLVDASGR
eukprot:m.1299029 g.1299029  ORF g.1299029 m.1299029 type:complete len:109 (+) comp24800_c0_seq11:1804-2130(+)